MNTVWLFLIRVRSSLPGHWFIYGLALLSFEVWVQSVVAQVVDVGQLPRNVAGGSVPVLVDVQLSVNPANFGAATQESYRLQINQSQVIRLTPAAVEAVLSYPGIQLFSGKSVETGLRLLGEQASRTLIPIQSENLLPNTLLEQSQQVVISCSLGEKSLVLSGQGGVSDAPTQILPGRSLWQDFRLAEAEPVAVSPGQENEAPEPSSLLLSTTSVLPDLPAQGWHLDSQGQVKLLAHRTPHTTCQ